MEDAKMFLGMAGWAALQNSRQPQRDFPLPKEDFCQGLYVKEKEKKEAIVKAEAIQIQIRNKAHAINSEVN